MKIMTLLAVVFFMAGIVLGNVERGKAAQTKDMASQTNLAERADGNQGSPAPDDRKSGQGVVEKAQDGAAAIDMSRATNAVLAQKNQEQEQMPSMAGEQANDATQNREGEIKEPGNAASVKDESADVKREGADRGDGRFYALLAIGSCSFALLGLCAALICRLLLPVKTLPFALAEAMDGVSLRIENRLAALEKDGETRNREVFARIDELKSAVARISRPSPPQATTDPAMDFFKGLSGKQAPAESTRATVSGVDRIGELERRNNELAAAKQRLEDEKRRLEDEKKAREEAEAKAGDESLRYREELEKMARSLQEANAARDEVARKYADAMERCRKYETEMADIQGIYGVKDDPDFLPLMEKLKRWSQNCMEDVALVKSALVIVCQGEKVSVETFMGALKDISVSLSSLLLAEGMGETDIEKELRTWAVHVQKLSTANRQFTLQVPSVGAAIDTSTMKVVSGNPSVVGGVRSWAVYGAFSIQYMAEVI